MTSSTLASAGSSGSSARSSALNRPASITSRMTSTSASACVTVRFMMRLSALRVTRLESGRVDEHQLRVIRA